jgi:hypothetical protein
MLYTIKKILFSFSAILCLFLLAGCGKDSDETIPPVKTASHYMLNYTAGDNGSIDGVSPQRVAHGGTGSPVRAVPSANYHFVSWSDGLATASRTDTNLTADLSVTASFAINQYTVAFTPGGDGAIEGPATQIVEHGSDAAPVTAVPAEHYHFVNWSDGVETDQRLDTNLTADLALTANFAIDQYTLTYVADRNGSISGESTQKVNHGGTASMVTAVPVEGYHFERWSDGSTAAQRLESGVTGDLELTATFGINQYSVTYSAGKNGSIEGVSPQTVIHGGDATPVTAVPAEHYHFAGWSDGISTAERTDRGVTTSLAVTATFAINQYTLSYAADNTGTIKGTGSQKIDYRGSGTPVTAVPAAGYHFENWSDGLTTISRTDSNVTTDLAVTAHFSINQYNLTYTANEHGTIEGVVLQKVAHGGDSSPVTAVAEKGYHFVNWSDGLDTAQRSDSDITGNLAVSAAFELNTYTIGGRVSGLVEGTKVVLQNNAGDDLEITTDGDFVFSIEWLNAEKYVVTVLNQPTSPNQTCTVTNGSGAIAFENITNVEVACVLNTYTIGGTISGIPKDDQVMLQNNGNNNLVLSVNGDFTFATPLDDGSKYEVTVKKTLTRPYWKCTVQNATGTMAGSNVTDIAVDCYPEPVLQATAGIHKVKLIWNADDFKELHANKVVFNLCRSQEMIPPDRFRDCQNLEGGVRKKRLDSPHNVLQLTNDITYWFQLQVMANAGKLRILSEVVTATPFGGLNDSGIDWCADDTANFYSTGTRLDKTESCASLETTFPGQDAFYGRDAKYRARKLSKTGTGAIGFDFTKLCRNGDPAGEGECAPNPEPGTDANSWACTHDNVTGLTWEIKTDSGLQSKNSTYTWYNQDGTVNGGDAGMNNGGNCQDSDCDTWSYIQTVNKVGICGASDWRLPTKSELLSIVDNSHFKPAVDFRLFPNTLSSHYWSSSPYPDMENSAWQVHFLYGEAFPNEKSEKNHVRLVRGRTVTFGLKNP